MAQITLNSSGVASNGTLALQSNGTTTAVTVDASQNVGIGTVSPGAGVRLEVRSSAAATICDFRNALSTGFGLFVAAGSSSSQYVQRWADYNASSLMSLDSSGNLGIGTTSPARKLHVTNVIRADGPMDSVYTGTTAGSALGSFRMYGDGAGVTGETSIRGILNSGSITSSYLDFSTTSSGTLAEKIRITSDGHFLVGKTALADATAGFQIYGGTTGSIGIGTDGTAGHNHVEFFRGTANALTRVGTINTNGSSTTYSTSSDYRLKENIAPMTDALSVVSQLKPCTYKWKLDGSDGQGFIAHELAEVVPDAVTGEKDAVKEQEYEVTPAIKDEEGNTVTEAVMGTRTVPVYQGVDTSFIVATLTAAIQEQQALITQLQADVAALKS